VRTFEVKDSKMKLSPIINRYFDHWTCNPWHSCHPLDNQRFYRFVKAVERYSRRKAPSRADIHALIMQKGEEQDLELDREELDELANEFAERYQMLLDYEKTKRFPNPLVEQTNILDYYSALFARCQGNDQHINRMMTKVWGKDWQTKKDRAIRGR
jgi:hypothetical protein